MRSNSVWGDKEPQSRQQDVASLLRSPLFFGAAVIIVAAVMVVSALNSEGWVEVGPIPVVQEREVSYLSDEGIFVFWNDGEPYGILEDIGNQSEPAVYCPSARRFLGRQGQVFGPDGRVVGRSANEGLQVQPARMDGHLVFVNVDRSEGRPAAGEAPVGDGFGDCEDPQQGDRGLLGG